MRKPVKRIEKKKFRLQQVNQNIRYLEKRITNHPRAIRLLLKDWYLEKSQILKDLKRLKKQVA